MDDMAKNFWVKYEYRAVQTDAGLRKASSAVRGAWWWVLNELWESGQYQATATVREWARAWNMGPRGAVRVIREIERLNIGSVTCNGDVTLGNAQVTLMSRRLHREAKERVQNRLRVQRHRGNADVTPHVTVQSKSKSKSKSNTEEDRSVPALVLSAWNAVAESSGIPKAVSLSAKRLRALRLRIKDEFWRDNWQAALGRIPGSDFLTGKNDRGWRANIDWFLRPGSVEKIIEGQYDGQAKGGRDPYDGVKEI